ncbi:MAG: hypothetical protein JW757_11700 [Anaerolineales bacterium]|nr:hypothetical protein [Anaerolineales bacterium]
MPTQLEIANQWVGFAEARWWSPDLVTDKIRLSEHLKQVLLVLEEAKKSNDTDRIWREIERIRSKRILMDKFEGGVALRRCGQIALELGYISEAADLFYFSMHDIGRGKVHYFAVVNWMLGVVSWLQPHGRHNVGIDRWQECINHFKSLAASIMTNKDQIQWYRSQIRIMVKALEYAIENDKLPHLYMIPGTGVTVSTSLDFAEDLISDLSPSQHKPEFPIKIENFFELFAVYEEIPAGLSALLDYVPSAQYPVHPGLEPDEFVEVTRVRIGEEEYDVLSLKRGESRINLAQSAEHFALRVRGTSMNIAGIDDGDLVVCRAQNFALHMDIAALVFDLTSQSLEGEISEGLTKLIPVEGVDNKLPATLKRYIEQQDDIIIKAESRDPSFKDFEVAFPKQMLAEEDCIRIHGVAVAVLKPV